MRPQKQADTAQRVGISIHALQTECDAYSGQLALQSKISIHALQTECDGNRINIHHAAMNFYPRTPNGVRPARGVYIYIVRLFLSTHSKRSATIRFIVIICSYFLFLSTHSKRSATSSSFHGVCSLNISIHALQTECDSLIKNMLIYGFLEYKFANNFKNTN